MSKLFDFWKNYRLRRSLKKRISALKTFRHTEDDLLTAEESAEFTALVEAGKNLLATPDKESCQEIGRAHV